MKYVIYAALLICCAALPADAFRVHGSVSIPIANNTFETPGPSSQLFNNPYYSCASNRYVGNFGSGTPSNSNNGTSVSTPWATIAKADATAAAGQCVNVAPGNYGAFINPITHGGNAATPTGYVVYRCTAPGSANGTGFSGSGCLINDTGKSINAGVNAGGNYPNYLIFDGFTLSTTSSGTFSSAFNCDNGDVGPTAPGCHHWVIINNVISGYSQSGIQLNNTEWAFILHNNVFNNSIGGGCNGGFAQGSGISLAAQLPLSGYTQTADDIGPTPKLGIYGNTNPNPIHNFVLWNVIHNNRVVGCGRPTDGNGLIFDSSDNSNTGVNYNSYSLAAFNIAYNNGGASFKTQISSKTIYANNSCFNSNIDLNIIDTTWISCILIDRFQDLVGSGPGNAAVLNNISYGTSNGVSASTAQSVFVSGNANDAYYNGGSCGGLSCGGNNVTTCTGAKCGSPDPFAHAETAAWSCTTNKCTIDPLWVNVDSTGGNSGSAGNVSTSPTGVNFALQAGSPAIGYAASAPFLPAATRDAGACDRSLVTCP